MRNKQNEKRSDREKAQGLGRGVWVHTRDSLTGTWESRGPETWHFARVPHIGERFVLGAGSPCYQVESVCHCPFADADCDAELFAIEVNDLTDI